MSQFDAGSPSLRELNIEARRRRILEAARRLIASGGMQALSMRKLAAEAGLSVTTLYNLYGVRGEILQALIDEAIDGMVEVLDAEAPLADPLERCRAVVTVSIRHLVEHEEVHRAMLQASYDQGLSLGANADRRVARRAANMQREGIAQAIAQGLLHDTVDPEELGRQIYHGYELACAQWAFGQIDEAGFRARALFGLYVALLAIATDETRPALTARLLECQRELSAPSEGGDDERRSA